MKTPNDSGKLLRAQAKLAQLQTDLTAKDKRLHEFYAKLASTVQHDPVQETAERMIAGGPASVHQRGRMEGEITQLREDITVLQRAVELAKIQRDAAHSEASREACQAAAPEHRKRVRAIVDAAIVLARANAAEQAIRDELESGGLSAGQLRFMQYGHVGRLGEYSSFIVMYLREALEHGFITPAEFYEATDKRVELPRSLLASLKEAA